MNLRFFRKTANGWLKVAEGTGPARPGSPMDVVITSGGVGRGAELEIRAGEASRGFLFACTAIRGPEATFMAVRGTLESIRAASHTWPVHPDPDHLKTLTVEIAPGDLDRLRMSGLSLCFAKRVVSSYGSNGFNMVWQANMDYVRSNTMSWAPQYELFVEGHFVDHINPHHIQGQPIEFGQQSIVDRHGNLGRAVADPGTTDMMILNEFGRIHLGLSQRATTIQGVSTQLPIYLSPRAIGTGLASLRPIENILVWFGRNAESSTFSAPPAGGVGIDFTGIDAATVRFADDAWIHEP
jgi:hypothetical protein